MNSVLNISIEDININEALRYLGYGKNNPDEKTKELLLLCSEELKNAMKAQVTYKVFDINEGRVENALFDLEGKSIKEHLENCSKAIFMCATLSSNVDTLIRKKQITSMTEAMLIDSLASAAIEQVCDKAEEKILHDLQDYEHTWRFGLGYGDFPLELQGKFLDILDAPKRVGVCVNKSLMLTPTKSVTCIIGLGHDLRVSSKKSCDFCSFRDKCAFRKGGTYCGK